LKILFTQRIHTLMFPRTALLTILLSFAGGQAAHAVTYMSHYSSGGGYGIYFRGGGYVSKIGGGSGPAYIDRTGARPVSRPAQTQATSYQTPPCGNYERRPRHCKNVTMAYNPDATISRTGGGLRFPVRSRENAIRLTKPTSIINGSPFRNNWVYSRETEY